MHASGSPHAERSACTRSSHSDMSCSWVNPIAPWVCSAERAASSAASDAATLAALTSRAVSGESVGQRQRRAVDQRPGQLERDVHVGELVLDRLIGADHLAELAALLGVFDRRVEHGLPRADQLRGGRQHTELVCACHVGGLAFTGCVDVEQLSARVDGLVLLTRGAVTDLAVGRRPGSARRCRRPRRAAPAAAARRSRSAHRTPARRCARRRRAEPVPPRWIR